MNNAHAAYGVVVGVVFVTTFVLVTYIAPWLVARYRRHPSSAAILALNLLLGWTMLGWAHWCGR